MNMILAVAAGGAIGAVLRLVVGRGMFYLMGSEFPWGTLVVNILGSFLVGLFVEILSLRFSLSHEWQGFIIIGVFGGFTTFSAFSLEVSLMIEKGDFSTAALYGLVSMFIGVLALFIGLFAGRALV
ncbi:MAG: fluoride efflux transporter CrcB [Sphingomonadales bacterium]|mgnify:FL=1|jgi:CrcB protein|tara:strand:+ start:5240 stop:5617 length:378 start_codon:yes stop_codon:yes gene_type:complete